MYTFIVFDKNGYRHSERVNVDNEDSAWDMINTDFPDADYIEMF